MFVPVAQLDRVFGYEPNTLPGLRASQIEYALVAQPDRVTGYEPVGRGFESLQARQKPCVDAVFWGIKGTSLNRIFFSIQLNLLSFVMGFSTLETGAWKPMLLQFATTAVGMQTVQLITFSAFQGFAG